jgi:hypothetical protein
MPTFIFCLKWQTVRSHIKKILLKVPCPRRAGEAQEQRYSALGVNDSVFDLKCLVPVPLRPVRNSG